MDNFTLSIDIIIFNLWLHIFSYLCLNLLVYCYNCWNFHLFFLHDFCLNLFHIPINLIHVLRFSFYSHILYLSFSLIIQILIFAFIFFIILFFYDIIDSITHHCILLFFMIRFLNFIQLWFI